MLEFKIHHSCLVALAAIAYLSPSLSAVDFHVSKKGSDSNSGSIDSPLLSISAAAEVAMPGDTITVYDGIYREEVNPPRGGLSDERRIVYQAAPGNDVEIRGSEIVTGWKRGLFALDLRIWKVEIPNTLFGDFNPFADEVSGDWFDPKERKHHTGSVYLDGVRLYEAADYEQLIEKRMSWFAEVGEETTVVLANFSDADPNRGLTEVNVRQTVFYPRQPFTNYITVRGFKMRHAAPKWAPPTAEQMALLGTHWSKGWIIEDNVISHSINAGISLGKYGDEFDNLGPTGELYLASIDRARENGWNRETIGSHIVRNNEVSWCEQAGIVGSMGAAFSQITDNYVHHIWVERRFHGAEMAGIKFHAPINALIARNRVHDAPMGLWLDWMVQGARVTQNLCYRNSKQDIYLEVNHGPFVVDNNLFLSELAKHHSQGGAYAHNLFAGSIGAVPDERDTPYFEAHSTVKIADQKINVGDDRFFNNVFNGNDGSHLDAYWEPKIVENPHFGFGKGLWVYDKRARGPETDGNIYYDGARPYKHEDATVTELRPDFYLIEDGQAVYLEMTVALEQLTAETEIVTSQRLGTAEVPNLPFRNYDGCELRIDTDYFGVERDPQNPTPGPFEYLQIGRNILKIW